MDNAETVESLIETCRRYHVKAQMERVLKYLIGALSGLFLFALLSLLLFGKISLPVLFLLLAALVLCVFNFLYLRTISQGYEREDISPAIRALHGLVESIQSTIVASQLTTLGYYFQSDKQGVRLHSALLSLSEELSGRVTELKKAADDETLDWRHIEQIISLPLPPLREGGDESLLGGRATTNEQTGAALTITPIAAFKVADEMCRALEMVVKRTKEQVSH